jgi:hypothetical protein
LCSQLSSLFSHYLYSPATFIILLPFSIYRQKKTPGRCCPFTSFLHLTLLHLNRSNRPLTFLHRCLIGGSINAAPSPGLVPAHCSRMCEPGARACDKLCPEA